MSRARPRRVAVLPTGARRGAEPPRRLRRRAGRARACGDRRLRAAQPSRRGVPPRLRPTTVDGRAPRRPDRPAAVGGGVASQDAAAPCGVLRVVRCRRVRERAGRPAPRRRAGDLAAAAWSAGRRLGGPHPRDARRPGRSRRLGHRGPGSRRGPQGGAAASHRPGRAPAVRRRRPRHRRDARVLRAHRSCGRAPSQRPRPQRRGRRAARAARPPAARRRAAGRGLRRQLRPPARSAGGAGGGRPAAVGGRPVPARGRRTAPGHAASASASAAVWSRSSCDRASRSTASERS